MAGKQYTHCIDVTKFDGITSPVGPLLYALGYGTMGALVGLGLFVGPVGWGMVSAGASAALGGPVLVGLMVAGAAYGIGEGICAKQLNGRLICLGKDKCAFGIIKEDPEDPAWISFLDPLDNDYTFNLTLLPHQVDDSRDNMSQDGFQGTEFVASQSAITSRGFKYEGERNYLHCEIEGGRAQFSCDVWKALAPFMGIAAAVCVAGFWIACLILLALLLVAVLSMFVNGHDPSASDAAVDEASGNIAKGDWVVVTGDHVFEGGHSPAWNEIHPVKSLQKINPNFSFQLPIVNATVPYDMSQPFFMGLNDFKNRLCGALGVATSPLTIDEQTKPKNIWVDHPDVSGCEPDEPPPVIR